MCKIQPGEKPAPGETEINSHIQTVGLHQALGLDETFLLELKVSPKY